MAIVLQQAGCSLSHFARHVHIKVCLQKENTSTHRCALDCRHHTSTDGSKILDTILSWHTKRYTQCILFLLSTGLLTDLCTNSLKYLHPCVSVYIWWLAQQLQARHKHSLTSQAVRWNAWHRAVASCGEALRSVVAVLYQSPDLQWETWRTVTRCYLHSCTTIPATLSRGASTFYSRSRVHTWNITPSVSQQFIKFWKQQYNWGLREVGTSIG